MSASNSPYPGYAPAQQFQPAFAQSQPNNAAFDFGGPNNTQEDRIAVAALTGTVPQSVHNMFMAMNGQPDEQAYQSQLKAAQTNDAYNAGSPDHALETGSAIDLHESTSTAVSNSDITSAIIRPHEDPLEDGPVSAGLQSLDGTDSDDGVNIFDWDKYFSSESIEYTSKPGTKCANLIDCLTGHVPGCPELNASANKTSLDRPGNAQVSFPSTVQTQQNPQAHQDSSGSVPAVGGDCGHGCDEIVGHQWDCPVLYAYTNKTSLDQSDNAQISSPTPALEMPQAQRVRSSPDFAAGFEQHSQSNDPNAAVVDIGNSDPWLLGTGNLSDPLPGLDFDISSWPSSFGQNIDASSDGVLFGHNGQLTSDSSTFEPIQNSADTSNSISDPRDAAHDRSHLAGNQAPPSPAHNSMPFQMQSLMHDPVPHFTQEVREYIQGQWASLQLQLSKARDEQMYGQLNGTNALENAQLQNDLQGKMIGLQQMWQQHQESAQELIHTQMQNHTQTQKQNQVQNQSRNGQQPYQGTANSSPSYKASQKRASQVHSAHVGRAPVQQSRAVQNTAAPSQYRINQGPQMVASGHGSVFDSPQQRVMNTGVDPMSAQRAQQQVSSQPAFQQQVSNPSAFQQQGSSQPIFQQRVPNQPVAKYTASNPVAKKPATPRSASRQPTPSRSASGLAQNFRTTPTGATKRGATANLEQPSHNKRARTAAPNAAPSSPFGMDHGRPIAQLFKLKWTDMTQMEKARLLLPILNGEHPLQAERNEQVHGQSYGALRQREALEKAQRLTAEAVKSAQAQGAVQVPMEDDINEEDAKQRDREAELEAELKEIRAAKKAKETAEKRAIANKKRAATIARKKEEAAQAAQAAQAPQGVQAN